MPFLGGPDPFNVFPKWSLSNDKFPFSYPFLRACSGQAGDGDGAQYGGR